MRNALILIALFAISLISATPAAANVIRTEANNGNLVMEGVPEIPKEVVAHLNRYQNIRSAEFLDWSIDGKSIFISTRFADISQIHRVDQPGGARYQITFFDEPVGGLQRQTRSSCRMVQ